MQVKYNVVINEYEYELNTYVYICIGGIDEWVWEFNIRYSLMNEY